MDNRPIGIFDSGIGGLTVFSEIKKQLPEENLIYLGDTKRVPYGDKSKETIIEFSRQCTSFLIQKNVKCIIIACGTATSQALNVLTQEFPIPILGIISPTVSYLKSKIEKDVTLKVGVIATKGTIRSSQWEKQISQNMDAQVFNKACPLLAPMAEEGWIQNEASIFAIHEYLKDLKQKEISHLILGCTHFPLFTNLIQKEMGNDVELINTGEKVADYLKILLSEKNISNSSFQKDHDLFYFTDMEPEFISSAHLLFKNQNINLSHAQKAIID